MSHKYYDKVQILSKDNINNEFLRKIFMSHSLRWIWIWKSLNDNQNGFVSL